MKLRIILEPSPDGGYTVYAPSLPGCISEGDSREEALANIRESVATLFAAEPTQSDCVRILIGIRLFKGRTIELLPDGLLDNPACSNYEVPVFA